MKYLLMLFFLFASTQLFAHGMDKPGPHGGMITMPGNFHIELLDNGENFSVYLLDINFKNPMVEKSSVVLNNFQCSTKGDYFSCPKPKELKAVNITAIRNGQKGAVANYSYPLKIKKNNH